MMVFYILILISMGKPVIFKQERAGKNEKPFMLYKFRSMKNAFDEYGVPLPDSERITPLGSFIRRTSIDELPSLINIIKGDMSIVGPRPLPTTYLPYYTEEERIRHRMRGGLTGLAQVNGRGTLSWEEKFKYDIEYVSNVSLLMDIKIIMKTIAKVLGSADIGERGKDAPMDFHVYRSGKTERELKGK